ncbi:MAG TPA: SNF2-related protein, partial [Verrucomicrobiae bacterium]
MSEVVLTEAFLAEIAGWEAMKQARGLLATGRVLSSDWTPPILKGVVQDGPVSYRAILVLKSENDVENHCSCRAARDWGTICAHSVAVGLHQLKGDAATALAPQPATKAAAPARSSGPRLQRAGSGGEPAELFVILPPNLEQALARGQVMLCFEAAWRGGRTPLNALPRSQPFCFPAQDGAVLDQVEYLAGGETPAMLMIENRDFAALLPALVEHPRLTLGRSTPLKVEPRSPRFLLELKGGLARLSALLQCAYGPRILTPGVTARDDSLWLPDPDSPTRYFTRDLAAEQSALDGLRRAGFAGPDAQGRLQLLGQNQVLNFFAREFSRLQREWEVTLEERLERSTTENLERIEPRFQITSSGVQWFDLAVSFDSGSGEKLSPADIQRLLLSGQSHQRLRNGRIALIDTGAVEELQEVLLDCSPQQHAQGYRLSSTQAGFLEATLRQHSGWQVQAPAAWRERARQQNGEAMMEGPPLGELEGVLRPYQKAGVAWLYFLRQNGFGGILADEMGLGKTLQTLALLDSKRRSEIGDRRSEIEMSREARPISVPSPNSDLRSPNLVVCPTSLVFNWVAEATKFTPALRVLALHGPDRSAAFERIRQSDLVITSYALIRRDAGRYSGLEFDTLVLDEAQHIKNRQTQNAQA